MKTITVQELKEILIAGGSIDLIDVRTPAEYAEAHIPEARLCTLDELDCNAVLATRKGEPHTPVYVLCHAGPRAKKAAAKFAETGFSEMVIIEGGTQAWIDAGFPVERAAGRRALSLDRQFQLTVGTLVLTGVLLAWCINFHWILLPGLIGAGLITAGITGACPMRSLLARMPWNSD